MAVRDRIKELRRVKASEIEAHPLNWRTHPDSQRKAMQGVLEEIGWADALLATETADGKYRLVDGHLRVDIAGDEEVPILVLDLDEDEAKKLLATLDPLAALAEADDQKLGELLAETETENNAVQALLDGLAKEHGIDLCEPGVAEETTTSLTLAERFGVPPFSVLDARQGYWQDRKRAWLALGIQSEIGRGMCRPHGKDTRPVPVDSGEGYSGGDCWKAGAKRERERERE